MTPTPLLCPRRFAPILALVAAIPGAASAGTLTVDPAGSGPYKTVTSAISAATTGDVVLVKPGTYTEDVSFQGKSIDVRSTDGAAVTVLRGTLNGVSFTAGETNRAVLTGFTLTGASAHAVLVKGASPTIADCVITAVGSTGYHGAAIYITGAGAHPTFEGVEITGALANLGTIYLAQSAAVTLTEPHIEGNQATAGAAVYAVGGSSVEIVGGSIVDNRASDRGGAIFASASTVELLGTLLTDNALTATRDSNLGGHMYGDTSARLSLVGCT